MLCSLRNSLQTGLQLRRTATAGLLAACFCASTLGDAVSKNPALHTPSAQTSTSQSHATETVQSLRYGVSLFYYYQHAYFDALTELMVGEAKQALAAHTNNAILLEGGMALSYGMDQHAEHIFESILRTTPAHADHDRAWFFLAKTAWQRSEPERAVSILANVPNTAEFEHSEEAQYLKAAALLSKGEPSAAQTLHSALAKTSRWRNYLSYNLGAERANAGDWLNAAAYFGDLNAGASVTEEDAALKERSLTASGYTYLSAGKPQLAQAAFQQVHTYGPMAEKALLGYGWSAAAQEDFQGALSPWHELAGRSTLNASTREGLLALPYAYLQLGHPSAALEHYQRASRIYSQALSKLNEALEGFRTKPVPELVGLEGVHSADWQFDQNIFPASSEAPFLQHLLTSHRFQISLRELRDLYHIEHTLLQATKRLRVLTEVDAHQQDTWASIVEEERRDTLAARQQNINAQLQTLRAKIDTAKVQGDGRALADKAQTGRWTRLERAHAIAANINLNEEHKDTLKLMRGLLLWNDSEAFPARIWEAQQELRQLETLTAESVATLRRVDAAVADKQQSNFAPRIAAVKARTLERQQQVLVTIALAEQHIRNIAITELEQQSDQLRRALGQSELGIAQLYDQALGDAQP